MNYVMDRRLNARHKSSVNRQRFLKRYRKQIKKAVDTAVGNRSITDMARGEKIGVPKDDINEPSFRHGPGGQRDLVLPGNKSFNTGDRIKRPPGGGGAGSGEASDSGEGEDDFSFQISQAEFLEIMFEDLELPNLVRKNLTDNESYKMVRGGFSEEGIPARLNIVRTMRSAQARRMALCGKAKKRLREVEEAIEALEASDERMVGLLDERRRLRNRVNSVPFLDDFDLKYNLQVKQPQPSNKAVMFCVMDVSGSMDQATKDIAKRFFILLYLFLQRNYEKTDIVFVRHHTQASEVDEETFFYSRETGGTIVSSALHLVDDIIRERYPAQHWNIYTAQASDGDNWREDSPKCSKLLMESLLPVMSYFAYVEITPGNHQDLWQEYEAVARQYEDRFALRQVVSPSDIYPVFKGLFKRQHLQGQSA